MKTSHIFSVCLFVTACTPMAEPPENISTSSASSSSSSVTYQKTTQMPNERTDVWSDVATVPDQSVPATLTVEQKKTFDDYIASLLDPEYEVTVHKTMHELPDNSVLIVGDSGIDMPHGWILHLSSTGAIVSLTKNPSLPLSFVGYADGIAYVTTSFSEGGGHLEELYAFDVARAELMAIGTKDAFGMDMGTTLDTSYLPADCTEEASESAVEMIARLTAMKLRVNNSDMTIGIPCKAKDTIIVPFAVTSSGAYGVATRFKDGELWLRSMNEPNASVFPPVYVRETHSGIELVHGFVNEQSNGAYYYKQSGFMIHPSFDREVEFGGSYAAEFHAEFCKTHSCVDDVKKWNDGNK